MFMKHGINEFRFLTNLPDFLPCCRCLIKTPGNNGTNSNQVVPVASYHSTSAEKSDVKVPDYLCAYMCQLTASKFEMCSSKFEWTFPNIQINHSIL